jgi:hypothetical protein
VKRLRVAADGGLWCSTVLHKDSSKEHIDQITEIEHRADRCVDHLSMASLPVEQAIWVVLSTTVAMVEEEYARFGPDRDEFKAAMVNLGRYCPMLIRWLNAKASGQPATGRSSPWTQSLGNLARNDLRVVQHYDAFQCSYPMWYRNRVHAEQLDNSAVRFTVDGSPRDRQVSAFHKGHRPSQGIFKAVPGQRVEPTDSILRRYQRILAAATVTNQYEFSYEHSYELARRTHSMYMKRLNTMVRRSEGIDLGGYTLKVFKEFYAALQSISAIHEYLCFCWMKWQHPYPVSSAVLVKSRDEWVKLLADLARIDRATTERIIDDMTLHSKRLPDLHVYPFVPLEESAATLALIPQFVLNSNPEENILRICSYLHKQVYDLLSNDKAATMRDTLLDDMKRYSIDLPDGSSEIDLLVEDEASSTVIIAELKWYRKPTTYRERLQADEQFFDGVHRQLQTIKGYCRQHPEFLRERQKLKRNLTDYAHVYYVLIARDHWIWVEPNDQTSVVDFEQFRSAIARHESLNDAVIDFLRYEWLPVEDRDFHVRFDSGIVEGVRVESEVFYAGPRAV